MECSANQRRTDPPDGISTAMVQPIQVRNMQHSMRVHFLSHAIFTKARLVNLPCPVEIHKTHDHAMYYKSCDIAQLLVVYEDEMAMEEAESTPGYKNDDYPSYFHSGLTPPLKRVVERRFAAREHKAVPPPRTEVSEIEEELKAMIDRISDSSKTKGKSKITATQATKVIEEVVEDVVAYESWMDDDGRMPAGIEFDGDDPRCTKHPELWLDPTEVKAIIRLETEKEEHKIKAATKKEEKKQKKSKKSAEADKPSTKKGIASKKNQEDIDMVTQAAAAWTQTDMDDFDILNIDLGGENFDFDNDELGLEFM